MYIKKTKSKNAEHYSIIYNVTINGKRTSKVYENIGNYQKLKLRAGSMDPRVLQLVILQVYILPRLYLGFILSSF